LALNPDLLFDANVLPLVLERAISFIVSWRTRTAECDCQAVADAEASERLLLGLVRFEGADFEDESSVEYEEVKGYCGW
jgi:hypothetical protein